MSKKIDRRLFAQNALVSAAGMSGLLKIATRPDRAFGSGGPIQKCVTFQRGGGSDHAWSVCPIPVASAKAQLGDDLVPKFFGYPKQPRCPDTDLVTSGDNVFGPALAAYSADDFAKMLVWRGIRTDGNHSADNRLFLNGHMSAYASSYSSLIANYLGSAPFMQRPLHYCSIASLSNEDFNSQPGMLLGAAVPIFIPGMGDWSALTTPLAGDPSSRFADRLKTTLENLGVGMVNPAVLQLRRNRDTVEAFSRAALNLLDISNSKYATGPEFTDLVASFKNAMVTDFMQVVNTKPSVAKMLSTIPAVDGNDKSFNDVLKSFDADTVAKFLDRQFDISTAAWRFALAAFLIIKDLSAVIDCLMNLSFDGHDLNDKDLCFNILFYAGLRQFRKVLEAAKLPDGRSYLDVTCVCSMTDFDRAWHRSPLYSYDRYGTGHGLTQAVALFGHRVNTSAGVIGGVMQGDYLGEFGTGRAFGTALPVDLQTGMPSKSGLVAQQTWFTSTVLALFGLSVPPQQFLGASVMAAAIDQSKKV